MSNGKPTIICLIGPSCAGKTTIAKKLLELSICTYYIRSITTRKKRPNEDDFEYNFVDALKLEECVEHTEYSGNHYGILKEEITNAIKAGSAVSVVTYDGYESIAKYCGSAVDVVPIGIDATELDIRIRLGGRTPEEREARMSRVKIDRVNSAECILHFVNATDLSVTRIATSISNLIKIIKRGYNNGDDKNNPT